jgi:hypothetical protein
MNLFNCGLAVLLVFLVADTTVRIRMVRAGHKWAFLLGGLLDYGEYLRLRSKYGWSAWPVYVIWITFPLGVVLTLIAGRP